jgi:hypothetical protein
MSTRTEGRTSGSNTSGAGSTLRGVRARGTSGGTTAGQHVRPNESEQHQR